MIDININHLVIDINNIIANKYQYDKLTIVYAYAFFEIIDDIHHIDETFMFVLNYLKNYMKCAIEFDYYEYIMKHRIEINIYNFISQMSGVLLSSTESLTSLSSNINKDTLLIHTALDNNTNIERMMEVFNYYDINKDGFISAIDVVVYLSIPKLHNIVTYLPYIPTIINLIYHSYKKIEPHEFMYYFDY